MSEINLDRNQYLELEKIALGAYFPLSGFMNEDDFNSVIEHMRLSDGSVFTIPIVLDLTQDEATRLRGRPRVALVFEGEEVGELQPENFFSCTKPAVASKIYDVENLTNPRVARFNQSEDIFDGDLVCLTKRM